MNFPHDSLTLIVKATFDLKPNQPALPSDDQAFPCGDQFAPQDQEQSSSVQYESDFAYFKPCADLLLAGKCYAPNGQPVTQCDVGFQVGSKSRLLRVFGNRYWEHTIGGGSISEPTKFVEMPICYENAFGGEGYKKNPVGRGIVKGKLLPNIEDPNHLIGSPSDTPDPAGFGALHRMWELRYSKLGTYKGDYLQKRWPWFPDDFHWGHFNAAPAEMQVEGYLRGDEPLVLENLHAVHAKYESQLPGMRVRCFTRVIDPKTKQHVFEEVTMNLDTLWVNMDEEKLVLLWRGWTGVASDEFEEIEHIFIMSEPLDQKPATVDQAHTLFKQKLTQLEKEWGTAPETPEKIIEDIKSEAVHEATKSTAETALKKVIAEEVEKPYVDAKAVEAQVDKMLTQLGVNVESLPAEAKQQMQEQQVKLINRITETDPAKLAEINSQELHAQLKAELAKLDVDVDNLPPISEKAQQEQQRFMQELGFEEEALVGSAELKQLWEVVSAILPKMGLDPEDLTPLLEHAKKQKEIIDKQSGVKLESEEEPEAELAAKKLKEIQSRVKKGETFVGEDCSGMDLSGLDLRGVDFTGAILIGANLQNSDLTGATLNEAKLIYSNLTNAKLNQVKMSAADCSYADLSCAECVATNLSASVFVNAKIIGADLSECDLSLANLTGSDLSGTKFENADMTLANASKAQLDNANLFGADLTDALFEYAQITSAKLDQVTAKDAIFSGANLSNSRFVEAKLSGADFSAGVLNDANFQGADLSEASLEKVTAKNINLSHANLEKLGASEASDFSGANLEQAQGKESIWHEANLNGANFTFSKMEGADFTKASLQNAQCYGADMRFARFRKTDLTSAQMLDMNLFKGSLEKANLTGTVFNGSNLYAVEFLDAHLEKTQLGGANVKATKLQEAV
ncbi:MAG: DUF2169 domain-containing protein [Gammaproteobacteria bacterium]|nr:DUF2169 domain-containing protein [Gammaproteobacteria bacterium]